MNSRARLLGILFVVGQMLQSYLAQVSHLPSEQVARWTLHDWAGSLLFVGLAGITAWKSFLTDPQVGTEAPPAK